MSSRAKITSGLSELLEHHLRKSPCRWGKEVRIWDPVECRVDYMSIKCPNGAFARIGDIEKASLACYEVKSCMADYRSGNGLNDLGDANWVVCPDELRHSIIERGESHDRFQYACPVPADVRSYRDVIPYDGEVDGWRLRFFGYENVMCSRRIPINQAMWAILCAGVGE